jgi:hypothetical protein
MLEPNRLFIKLKMSVFLYAQNNFGHIMLYLLASVRLSVRTKILGM